MNRINKYVLVFTALALVVIILFWLYSLGNKQVDESEVQSDKTTDHASLIKENLSEKPATSLTQQPRKEQDAESMLKKMKELIRNDYNSSINFWGKVVDQDGAPLAGAKAEMNVYTPSGQKVSVVYSNDEGLFELLGKRGAKVSVRVSLSGYAPTSNEEIGTNVSARTIYYSTKVMPAYAPPTKENPQVFVLRKKNPIANLLRIVKEDVPVSKIGDIQKITLEAGKRNIEFEVRCWSSSPSTFTYDKYDWRAELRIIGGKLQTITEAEPIMAPIDGYLPIFKIEMPKDIGKTWKATNVRQRDFWLYFNDETYAKARIEVKTGRKHEVDVEVWYNLDRKNNFEQ